MRSRIYEFPGDKSRARAVDDLAAAIREVAPDLKTLAEAERRRQVIRTCRVIERRERRDRHATR
jgi:hypothetical protein